MVGLSPNPDGNRRFKRYAAWIRRSAFTGTTGALLATALFAIVPGTVAAAGAGGGSSPFIWSWPIANFCGTPFLGDLATWGTPKFTKFMMLVGGVVFAWGIFAADGQGRLSLRQALGLGLVLFFLGFQWEQFWTYVGGIFGNTSGDQMNALTCGLGD